MLAMVNETCNEEEVRTEMYSHADTCVIGSNGLVLYDHNRSVKVTGYDRNQAAKEMRTVTAALAYDDPIEGTTLILIVHQAISIPAL